MICNFLFALLLNAGFGFIIKKSNIKLNFQHCLFNEYHSVPSNLNTKTLLEYKNTLVKFSSLASFIFFFNKEKVHASGIEDANNKLSGYSLPPIIYVPNGYSALVSEFGRGNAQQPISNPILVQFVYPQLWVVQKTSGFFFVLKNDLLINK
jgi:hypothetical protein